MTKVSTNRLVLADTGFWIAFYDRSDQYHKSANAIMEQSALGTFLFPWPLYYELLRTRFVKRAGWVESFLTVVKQQRISTIDDSAYRVDALRLTMDWASGGQRTKRSISLVDMVLRLVLEDPGRKIDELITFNTKDFADICYKKGISIRSSAQ